MTFPDITPDLKASMPDLRGRLLANQSLAELTWFRVGGPAQVLFTPSDQDDLAYFLARLPNELPVYVVGLGLLIGVALFGEIRNGARRWLSLGFTTVQPSEVMKIAVPLVLAWYFHRREEGFARLGEAERLLLTDDVRRGVDRREDQQLQVLAGEPHGQARRWRNGDQRGQRRAHRHRG